MIFNGFKTLSLQTSESDMTKYSVSLFGENLLDRFKLITAFMRSLKAFFVNRTTLVILYVCFWAMKDRKMCFLRIHCASMYIIWFGLNHAGQSALKKAIISLSQMKPLHALFSLNCISFCAAVSMVGDYHCDSMDPKRYSVDPSDSAYGAMSSPYTASKPAYGFRSSTAYSGGVCRQAASPSTFQEGNRSGKRGNVHLFTTFRTTLQDSQNFKIPGSPSGRYSSDFGSPKIYLTSPNKKKKIFFF